MSWATIAKVEPDLHAAAKKSELAQLFERKVPPLFAHQEDTTRHLLANPRTLDASDPGTGKTRSHLTAWALRRSEELRAEYAHLLPDNFDPGQGKCLLVLAPLSLVESAWRNDSLKFLGAEFSVTVALAKNRAKAFEEDADIYVTNIDAVRTFLAKQPAAFFDRFDEIIVDESTAFKNPNSKRSKALNKIKRYFDYRRVLTGTPNSKSVLDVWNQIYFIDDGAHLGAKFFPFRNSMCTAVQVGPRADMVQWQDKPDAERVVAGLISDITIRHKFEECIDVPKNFVRSIEYELGRKHKAQYEELASRALLEFEHDAVAAVNAAVLANKLLQVASGAVYSEDGYQLLDTGRYELILDLATEVDHSVVFFLWQHQKAELVEQAEKRGVSYGLIDGSVAERKRADVVQAYQDGVYQTIFLHPKSAAHGITLTRGCRTVWASPTYEPDVFKQGNHRIYRAGQQRRTETVLVQAAGTLEAEVYAKMNDKHVRMDNLLEVLKR